MVLNDVFAGKCCCVASQQWQSWLSKVLSVEGYNTNINFLGQHSKCNGMGKSTALGTTLGCVSGKMDVNNGNILVMRRSVCGRAKRECKKELKVTTECVVEMWNRKLEITHSRVVATD